MMGMQVGKRINIVPFLGVQSNQVSFDWATKSKVVFTFSVPKKRTIFFAIGLCYARRPKHISSWHAITSLSEQNQKEMKHMGLRYDTFRVRDMHKYVITYTVAHQQYTNKCASSGGIDEK